jgi:uncharacterized membrane protein
MSRPRLKLPSSPLERFLDGLALIVLVVSFTIALSAWGVLPDRFPRHFGISGPPDAWGGKGNLLFLPILNLVFFICLTVLGRYPHLYNYPWKITGENAPRQYLLARTLVGWLRVVVMTFFTYLEWLMIQITRGNMTELGKWFLPALTGVMIGSLGVYLLKARRAR